MHISRSYFIQYRAALGVGRRYVLHILDRYLDPSQNMDTECAVLVLRQDSLQLGRSGNNPISIVRAFALATRAGGPVLRRPVLGVTQEVSVLPPVPLCL